MEDNRSAVWGGATLGLFVGLILAPFVGDFWTTVLSAAAVGAAAGVLANFLGIVGNLIGWLGNRRGNRGAVPKSSGRDAFAQLWLEQTESVLSQACPADFETTQNAASTCVAVVQGLEDGGWWYPRYDSLESFYAAHEARHPDIRLYAAVGREIGIEDPDEPPDGTGEMIARRIAARRHPAKAGT